MNFVSVYISLGVTVSHNKYIQTYSKPYFFNALNILTCIQTHMMNVFSINIFFLLAIDVWLVVFFLGNEASQKHHEREESFRC